MVYTECMDAALGNLSEYAHKIYFSHNLKIPDSQNFLVDQALKGDYTHLLFIEEDTVMPEKAVRDMLALDADVACIDYGVAGYSCLTKDGNTGEILWCGLGCTLIKREVFDSLEKPYFRSDKALLLNNWPEVQWIDAGKQAYGLQDIWFFMQAREKGYTIKQAEGECRHLQLESLGKREINNGLHVIKQKPKISKYQVL
jgi:hypothetical protein